MTPAGTDRVRRKLLGRLSELDSGRQNDAPGATAVRLDPKMAADVPQALVDVLQHVVGERTHAPSALRRPAEIDALAGRLQLDQMMAVLAPERDAHLGMTIAAGEVEEQLLDHLEQQDPLPSSST